jgi:sterol desaturase/sphingolipid hydroxylase (fatty acid hydroxylase superfamily)
MIDYLTQHGVKFLIDVFRLGVWLVILASIFVPLERLFALHGQKILRPEIGADLGYYFLNGLLPAMLMSVVLSPLAWGIHKVVPHGFHAAVAEAPFWVRMLAGLVVGDVAYYWAHRCLHAVPILWRFHAVHHSAPRIDFLVNSRAHPIDMVFGRLCGVIPLYVLGLAGPAGAAGSTLPVAIVLTGTVWGFFIHANVRWRFGPLAWLLSTPHFHHWHHTIDAPLSRNYASMLPWVDRMFGTHYLPKGQWPSRYGIAEAMPDSMGEQLLQPFLERRPSPAG